MTGRHGRFLGISLFFISSAMSLQGCVQSGKLMLVTKPASSSSAIPPPLNQARLLAPSRLAAQQGFSCLDGKNIKSLLFGNKSDLVVSPGRHYVTVKVKLMGATGTESLWIDAEANHVYDIISEERTGEKRAGGVVGFVFLSRFVDHASGQVVGGLEGGQPPIAQDPKQCY